MVLVFPDMSSSWSVSSQKFPLLRSAWSGCTEGSGKSPRIISENFSVLYFPFSRFPTIMSTVFFLKFMIHLVIFEVRLHFSVITHKWCIYYRLNDFKLTGIVYCNPQSPVILVNEAKCIRFYSTFQLPPTVSHWKYKPFITSIEFCLFRHKYWLKHLSGI